MDPHQPEIIVTVNDSTSTEIEKSDSGSKSQNLNRTSDEQGVRAGERNMNPVEGPIPTLAQAQGLKVSPIDMWTAGFNQFSDVATRFENVFYKREEKMRSVKNEIYQVVGFFSAFQGLLITAAAQSNLLHCNNLGFILALSAFATVVAVFGIWQKITAIEELRFNTNDIKNYVEAHEIWQAHLLASEINFQFGFFQQPPNNPSTLWKAILFKHGTWLLVCAFGGLCAVAMRQIVCNPGHSLPSN
ncbi:hypothetical protein BDL97_13G106300 [Sphagnum fallax]|nr:hypothetical protein BDL97_13G106300 [Sphagnum fallax]